MSVFSFFGDAATGLFSLEFAGNYLGEYTAAVFSFFAVLIAIKIAKYIIIHKIGALAKKTKTEFDDILIEAISKIGLPFYLVVAAYVAFQFVKLPATVSLAFHYLLIITMVFYSIRILEKIAGFWLNKSVSVKSGRAVTSLFEAIIKIALWSVALLLILSNLGYNITSLIAGMGIAGIAIAFALQRILEDVFSAFTIYYDKPFEVGDFIIIGTDMGTVKDIGLQSTRLITLEGQELVVSNREITNTRINNYKKMKKRRVVFPFGVTYETPRKKLEMIPGIIKKVIEKTPDAEFSRAHFKSFGNFSLDFEVVYYMLVPEYEGYMDAQQQINLELKKEFEKQGIEFA
ncbi:MAG: mechanosensitive ion channel family protein [Candidatus Diapherotrites archaeon]